MRHKTIPKGAKIPVYLSLHQRDLIRDHTFCDTEYLAFSVVEEKGLRFDWSFNEIENIQGYVAAEANHCENQKLQRELDALSERLETYLISYQEDEG